jgi:hypothetical protein
VRLEGLGKLKKSTSFVTRTSDLPACSIVPEPNTLARAPLFGSTWFKFQSVVFSNKLIHHSNSYLLTICDDHPMLNAVQLETGLEKLHSVPQHTNFSV